VPARLAGVDPRQDLRRALREAKALLEAGEGLRPDTPHDTPGGKLVGLLSRRCGGEGVLCKPCAGKASTSWASSRCPILPCVTTRT
jgi:hypothetical protein